MNQWSNGDLVEKWRYNQSVVVSTASITIHFMPVTSCGIEIAIYFGMFLMVQRAIFILFHLIAERRVYHDLFLPDAKQITINTEKLNKFAEFHTKYVPTETRVEVRLNNLA